MTISRPATSNNSCASSEHSDPFSSGDSPTTTQSAILPSRPLSLNSSGTSSSIIDLTVQHDVPQTPPLSQRTIRFSLQDTVPQASSHGSRASVTSLHSPPAIHSRPQSYNSQENMYRQRTVSHSSFAPLYKRSSSSRTTLSACVRKPHPSTKLVGEIDKPWKKYPDPAHRWGSVIFWALVALGFVGAAGIVALGYLSIPTPGKLCMIMDEDWSSGINPAHWSHEVRVDGYGNKQFEWTTTDSNNSFVEDGTLYIVPTLTSDSVGVDAITNGYALNLTADGRCTGTNLTQCVAISNATTGSIINPVQGARLVTRGKASIKYGKVEIMARMPTGDWIWPAIWMMPEADVYGDWPRSGEIDIVESRGNNHTYGNMGQDYVQSALHWGPNSMFDSYWRTMGDRQNKVKGFANDFNKFTLEWTDRYITTCKSSYSLSLFRDEYELTWQDINNRAYSVLDLRFDQSFWNRGRFPTYYVNGTQTLPLSNPWYSSSNQNAPFDQSFYLILNVAVGGTNGFFPDNQGQKPWLDSSLNAMADFWKAKDRWYPTWPADPKKRGMAIKSVKMWQKC